MVPPNINIAYVYMINEYGGVNQDIVDLLDTPFQYNTTEKNSKLLIVPTANGKKHIFEIIKNGEYYVTMHISPVVLDATSISPPVNGRVPGCYKVLGDNNTQISKKFGILTFKNSDKNSDLNREI